MPETYSAKQVASRIGTDAKTLRKFLRSPSSPYKAVGQGKRYEFPMTDLGTIKKAFTAWQSKNRARMNNKVQETKPAPAPAPVTEEEITETIMELPDNDPTDEDLEEIEDEGLEIDDE